MKAKYEGTCWVCGNTIMVGEDMEYDRENKRARHPSCKPESGGASAPTPKPDSIAGYEPLVEALRDLVRAVRGVESAICRLSPGNGAKTAENSEAVSDPSEGGKPAGETAFAGSERETMARTAAEALRDIMYEVLPQEKWKPGSLANCWLQVTDTWIRRNVDEDATVDKEHPLAGLTDKQVEKYFDFMLSETTREGDERQKSWVWLVVQARSIMERKVG